MFGKRNDSKSTFYCFSPEVMLATFTIEAFLAVYTWIRYRSTAFGRLVTAMLLLLGTFQVAEYLICSGSPALLWANIGFAAITFLPPLGLHLLSFITGRQHFVISGYTLAIAYTAYFLLIPGAISSATCGGNYVIIQTTGLLYWTYSFYYLGFLILGIWEAWEKIRELKTHASKKILYTFVISYLSFLLPSGIVYLVSPKTLGGGASIMCGFALIMALIVSLKITPMYHKRRRAV